jgi:hypothetical protein
LNEAGLKEWIYLYKECFTIVFWFLNNASQNGDYKNADDLVESLNGFQKRFVVK